MPAQESRESGVISTHYSCYRSGSHTLKPFKLEPGKGHLVAHSDLFQSQKFGRNRSDNFEIFVTK